MNLFEKKYYEETERFKVKEKAKIISELYSLKERIELLLKGEINDELLKRTLDEIDYVEVQMYNIEHLKVELKEFEIEFYDYKNVLLSYSDKLRKAIKMHFYLAVIDLFQIANDNNRELYKCPTQEDINNLVLEKLFDIYWVNVDYETFNIDNTEHLEDFLAEFWRVKKIKEKL